MTEFEPSYITTHYIITWFFYEREKEYKKSLKILKSWFKDNGFDKFSYDMKVDGCKMQYRIKIEIYDEDMVMAFKLRFGDIKHAGSRI